MVDRACAIRVEDGALADELSSSALGDGSATAVEPAGELGGEVVVLALYYPEVLQAADQYRDRLAGKVVVEISNPVDVETWDRLVTPPDSSAAEEVSRLVPEEAPVVKAFNTTFGAPSSRARRRASSSMC